METKLKDKAHSWLASKFDGVCVFSSGLASGYIRAGVVMVLDNSLTKHVSKVSKIPGHLFCIKLLFRNKLLVSILGLYAGASLTVRFSQAAEINFLIARTVNESSFVIFGGDFNENGSQKCTSFKKCFDLGLVNSLGGSSSVKLSTWCNSRGVAKTIDFMFILSNLIGAVVDYDVAAVNDYFDTDHKTVSVSMSLGGCWIAKWIKFKEDTAANTVMFCDEFGAAGRNSDLVSMWNALCQVVCLSFKGYDSVFNKASFRFHKLELLVLRIVKALCLAFHDEFVSLLGLWSGLDSTNASVVKSLFLSVFHFDAIQLVLAKIRKSYYSSKLSELDHARESQIRLVIDRRIESFELNKGYTIKSVLECPFRKVVLDYLVVGDKLILEPNLVKSKMNMIMEAFSGIISSISFDELFGLVSGLPDGKAAGLSEISNELWKRCNKSVLDMLLVLLNSCLLYESWKGVLTNTHSIALIEMAHKILFKILSDWILLACSMFDVLYSDNFSVLKGTFTQSPIFAVGSIVEDVLEKNRKLWLVLQDMKKVYDSVGWKHLSKCLVRIKMCNKFIQFFNVMTDFGLTSGYHVHNGLDQREKSVCGYKLNSYFISKSGYAESQVRFSTFFAVGVFVDDTIWVGSSLRATQHIFNIAMAIPINSRVSNPSFFISGSLISIARKGESYRYLGIFLSTENLSKPSLIKTHSDIHFFTNLVLRKTITDKQLLYLVLVVLHSIVSYKTQFSFVPVSVCNKWDVIICKALKLKSGLPLNFPVVFLISFVNSNGILGHLFSHRSHDLQVLCWCPVHLLSCPVHIYISASNNFLTGLVCVLFDCNLSLGGSLANAFRFIGGVLLSLRRYGIAFVNQLCDCHGSVFSWYTFKQWKRLDPYGPIPDWFRLSAAFFDDITSSSAPSSVLDDVGSLSILGSGEFLSVYDHLSCVKTGCLSVYTDRFLRNLGMVGCKANTAAFSEDVGLSLGIGILDLMSSTLAELQAIALALECIPPFNSQSVLDACKLELGLLHSDFHSQCWVEHQHIVNLIHEKILRVSWHKVKDHSGVEENEQADVIAGSNFLSSWFLPSCLDEHFLVANSVVISDNSRHFV
ncbi:hypothetical protein G9A89_017178 [Geosiphon pyriformis]|nr:hypothetical protein G9A89_017178 [Geosiphon pyriformis]